MFGWSGEGVSDAVFLFLFRQLVEMTDLVKMPHGLSMCLTHLYPQHDETSREGKRCRKPLSRVGDNAAVDQGRNQMAADALLDVQSCHPSGKNAGQSSTRYKCVLVRRKIVLPTTAGEAMKPSSSLLTANCLYSRPGAITVAGPS